MRKAALAFISLIILGASASLAVTSVHAAVGTGTGLPGDYYDNSDFTNLKLARIDPTINFSWGQGAPASSSATPPTRTRALARVTPTRTPTAIATVSVQEVAMRTGAGWNAHAARTASVRNANRLRPCWTHVACTLSIRSTKRLPLSLWVP
jgi:hypothetical protein